MEAQALKAGMEELTGHTDQAVLELRACLPQFRARHMHLWSACIAHELGRRIGGGEGRALLAEATSGFAMHGIKNPELTLRGMLPGLSEAG
jgi:hypothetical protein